MPFLFVGSYLKVFKLQAWRYGLVFMSGPRVGSVVELRACSQPVWEESKTGLSCLLEVSMKAGVLAGDARRGPGFIFSKACLFSGCSSGSEEDGEVRPALERKGLP